MSWLRSHCLIHMDVSPASASTGSLGDRLGLDGAAAQGSEGQRSSGSGPWACDVGAVVAVVAGVVVFMGAAVGAGAGRAMRLIDAA